MEKTVRELTEVLILNDKQSHETFISPYIITSKSSFLFHVIINLFIVDLTHFLRCNGYTTEEHVT